MKSSVLAFMAAAFDLVVYGYLGTVLGVLTIIWFTGDRWWFGTMLLYGPRWIYAFPMIGLVPLALLWRRRSLWLLGLTALIIVWPIMELNVPLTGWVASEQPSLRVLTYNVARWEVSGEEFSKLLDEVQPDLAAVQECAPNLWKVPPKWYFKRSKTSVIVSRYPITRCELSRREPDVNGIYCVIETPDGPIGFGNVDLLTPRRGLAPMLDRNKVFDLTKIDNAQMRIAERWQESEDLFNWLNAFPEARKIFAGDFNLTVDSGIYRKVWSDYQNAYSQTEFGFGHTKYTKINIFRYGTRIDHILSAPQLRPLRSWVGPDYGSDHRPLIADFARD
jgi:vancomycin resistance protein VanJ